MQLHDRRESVFRVGGRRSDLLNGGMGSEYNWFILILYY